MKTDNECGGTKYDSTKVRMEILPFESLIAAATIMTEAAAGKYGVDNWRKGLGHRRLAGAVFRHFTRWMMGEDFDPDSGRPHTWHMLTTALFIVAEELNRPDLDDRFKLDPGVQARMSELMDDWRIKIGDTE
jgi:hypothetical protein